MSRISDLAGFSTSLSSTQDLSVGVITATTFSGDGSGLTGVASTDNIQTATDAKFLANVNITGITTATGGFVGDLTGDVTGNTSGTAGGLTGTPDITVGSVTAASGSFSGNVSVGGTLTYQDVTNIDSIGIITAQQGIQVLANGINVTGVTTVGVVTGATSIQSGIFYGDGSGLTNLPISTAPKIIAFSPEALTTGNSVSTNITITFDQNIKFDGTGDIVLRSGSSTGTAITTFTITNGTPSSGITTSGTQLIINPTEDFDTDTNVFVILPSSGISNLDGDAYDGSDTYNFRTEIATFTLQGGDEAFNIADSNSPTGFYRYHIFSSSGIMTASSDFTQADDFTMFAIGGGGGSIIIQSPADGGGSGGGGAGGFLIKTGPTMGLAAGTYTVTVGAGGVGGYVPLSSNQYQTSVPSDAWDGQGGDTTITAPTSPTVYLIRAYGGGRGAVQVIEPSFTPANPTTQPSDPLRYGQPGGSGGGAAGGATANNYSQTGGTSLFGQGNAGGVGWTFNETLPNPLSPGNPFSDTGPNVTNLGPEYRAACGGGGAGGAGEGYNAYRAIPDAVRYDKFFLAGDGGIGTAISSTFPGTEIIPRITTIPSDSLTEYGAASRIGGGGGGGYTQYGGPGYPIGPSSGENPGPTSTYYPDAVQDSWPKNGRGGAGGGGDGAIFLSGAPTRGYSPYRQNQAGFTNLGGGAGGGAKHIEQSDSIQGKNGGSGVIFIRYATPSL